MKNLFLTILLLFSILSCNKDPNESNSAAGDQIPDLSIYHLPAKWHTQNGNAMALEDLKGQVLVMVMIYTSCKVACPRLVADMRGIEAQIPKQYSQEVKYVLVSIDPTTDTPERLKEFAIENEMDNEQWVFLQGTEESVREFAAVLAVSYKKISPLDFSHSNIISVFDQEGVMVHQQEGLSVNNKETVGTIIELAEKKE